MRNQPLTLRLIHGPYDLPYEVTFPLHAAALEDRLVLAWAEAGGQAAWLGRLDRDGSLASPPVRLALGYLEGMAECNGILFLVAALPGETAPHLVALDRQGNLAWERPLPVEDTLVRWPRPVCAGGRLYLYWELCGERPFLCAAVYSEGELGPVWKVSLTPENPSPNQRGQDGAGSSPGALPSDALEAAAFGNGIVVAQVPSSLSGIELIHIQDQEIVTRAWVGASYPSSLALAGGNGRLALLWISNPAGDLLVQEFGADLAPLGERQPAVHIQAPAEVRSARFIPGEAGRLALSLQVGVPQDPRNRGRGVSKASQFIGPYAWEPMREGPFVPVAPAGTSFDTGAWIGDRLLLVHGERQPVVSVFELAG
jgi:hypothetical protein